MPKTSAQILNAMEQLLDELRDARPEERSEISRAYAVAITDLEKVFAYFQTFVVDNED